jgi:intracellular sulfur oxidation DsrE/DsrF family protein
MSTQQELITDLAQVVKQRESIQAEIVVRQSTLESLSQTEQTIRAQLAAATDTAITEACAIAVVETGVKTEELIGKYADVKAVTL